MDNNCSSFVANLFRTLYHNRPSSVKDVTKTCWLTFFLDTVYDMM